MSDLGDRLRQLPLPPADAAKLRTRVKAAALVDHAPGRRSLFPILLLRVSAAALLVAVALVAFALSPPGRAFTDQLVELVGIGDPADVGERASLPPRKAPRGFPLRVRPTVIASGRAPDGTAYEVVASRGVDRKRRQTFTCLTLDLPESPPFRAGEICLLPGPGHDSKRARDVDWINVSDRATPGGEDALADSKARYVLTALLASRVQRVEVRYSDESSARQTAYSDVGQVDRRIARSIGTKARLGYLVAFLPDDGLPSQGFDRNGRSERRGAGVLGTVTLIAYDATGREVSRKAYSITVRRRYQGAERRRLKYERFEEAIAAAQQRDGLALTRANVRLCENAQLAGVRSEPCDQLIHAAAARNLYGWTTNRKQTPDVGLPEGVRP